MPNRILLMTFVISISVFLVAASVSNAQTPPTSSTEPAADQVSTTEAPEAATPLNMPPGTQQAEEAPYPYVYGPYPSQEMDERYIPDVPGYDNERPRDWYERDWRYRMRTYRGTRFSRERYSGGYTGYSSRRYYYSPRADEQYSRWHSSIDPYPYYDYSERAFDDGYWQGRRDGIRIAEYEQQQRVGTTGYLSGMRLGLEAFRYGDYMNASKQFNLACRLNQGDAASRLHLAHALTALGRYKDASMSVRRAIQLQTRLVYLMLDIRSDYGDPEDFEKHYQLLESHANKEVDDSNLWFLLAYYQFFSGRELDALKSIERANTLTPNDRVIQRLHDAIKLSTPASEEFHMDPPAPPASDSAPTKEVKEIETTGRPSTT